MILADIVQNVEKVGHLWDERGVWFGWPVDEKYRCRERRLTFKCKAFERRQFRQGNKRQAQITSVDDSQTTTAPCAAGFLSVAVASIWLVPGFCKTHQIRTLIQNMVMYEARFVCDGLCIKQFNLDGRWSSVSLYWPE